jgi:hypothetical protein
LKIKSSHTIDVVIAWVDGADPKHKKKRLSFLDNKDVGELAGAAETRFNSLNEVEYCVLSILKFAPFVRNIYIVTDNQDPKIDSAVKKYFPERQKDIRIVDHKSLRDTRNFYQHLIVFVLVICFGESKDCQIILSILMMIFFYFVL